MVDNNKKDIFYTDPVTFFEKFLDIKLHWWQKILLRWHCKHNSKFIITKGLK
jgi:hypothetical protein